MTTRRLGMTLIETLVAMGIERAMFSIGVLPLLFAIAVLPGLRVVYAEETPNLKNDQKALKGRTTVTVDPRQTPANLKSLAELEELAKSSIRETMAAVVAVEGADKTGFASGAQEVESKSYPVLSGVGLALNAKDGHLYVGKVVSKSPADESGLIPEGAQLVAIEVNGKETLLDGKTVGEAASLIRGPVGTELVLTVVPSKDGTAINVRLIRAPLEIAGVSATTYKAFIGKAMPKLKLTSLDGTRSSQLADYRGKVVVFDFWASWCPTCYPPVTKMQTLLADNPRWKGKVELMTVTVDSELSKAAGVVEKQKWNCTLNRAVDIEELNAVGITVIPLVIVIAPDGTVATMAAAHALDIEKEVAALLKKLMD